MKNWFEQNNEFETQGDGGIWLKSKKKKKTFNASIFTKHIVKTTYKLVIV